MINKLPQLWRFYGHDPGIQSFIPSLLEKDKNMGLPDEVKDDFHVTLIVQQKKHGPSKQAEVDVCAKAAINTAEYSLWGAFKNGSEQAFTLIYKQYLVSLYNYGEMITSNKELIEDSIHDLFVDLWKNRDSIAQAYSIKFYLYKGLKRKIIKNLSLKRRLPFNDFSEGYDFEIIFSHEFNIITLEVSEAQKKSLLDAVNKLSHRQKAAIVLRFYDNLSFREIADLLSISIKSTYTLTYRAIEVLKHHIGKISMLLVYLPLPFLD